MPLKYTCECILHDHMHWFLNLGLGLFIVVTFTINPTGSAAVSTKPDKIIGFQVQQGFESAVKGLSRAVEFYSEKYDQVNLDAIFGLRVAEGFIDKALKLKTYPKVLKSGSASFEELIHDIKEINTVASSISEKFLEASMSKTSSYLDKFRAVIREKWTYMLPHRTHKPNLITSVDVFESKDSEDDPTVFNEVNSDLCMANLMGTQEEGEKKACVITDNCWIMMTRKKTGGYIITHQALYFMLADVKGCHSEVVKRMGTESKLKGFIETLGANIYSQMKKLYDIGLPKADHDLFIEQAIVCSMLGLVEAFKPHYLAVVVGWQSKIGCLMDPEADKEEEPSEAVNEGKGSKNLKAVGSRTLKAEEQIEGGCMSHMTGVATGFFGIYINWFLDMPDYKKLGIDNPWDPSSNRRLLWYNKTNVVASSSSMLRYFVILIVVCLSAVFLRRCLKRRGIFFRRSFFI